MAIKVTENFKTADEFWSKYKKSNVSKNSLTTPTSGLKTPVANPNPVGRPAGDGYVYDPTQTYTGQYQKAQGGQNQIGSIGLQSIPETSNNQGNLAVLGQGTVNNNIDTTSLGDKPNFTALKNTYGDFFAKSINTNPSLQNTIQSSFSKGDPEYDYANMKTFLDTANQSLQSFKDGGETGKQQYQRIKQNIGDDLGKTLLLDTYLKSQGVNVDALKTNQQVSTPVQPTQTPTQQNNVEVKPTDIQKNQNVSTQTTTTTPIQPTQTQTNQNQDFINSMNEYKNKVEADKANVSKIAQKYGIDTAKFENYYAKQLEDFTNGIKTTQNSMSGAFDSIVKDARTFNADQMELFSNIKNAALEDARIKGDKDLLEKEKYYNEVERSLKIQKIKNRSNDVLTQQLAIAMGNAVGERFGTGSVRVFNDAVKEGDLLLNEIENKLLENQNLKVRDLANIRSEYNNTQDKINNAFLANVQSANKSMMDTINSVVLQKGKSNTDSLQLIKNAKDNYVNTLIGLQDKKYQEVKDLNNQLLSMDQEFNKTMLSATQQQLESQQKAREFELDMQKQNAKTSSNQTVTGPLSPGQVESVILLTGGSKLSDQERKGREIQIQEMANNGMSLDDIKLNLDKKFDIKSQGIFNELRNYVANGFIKNLSNAGQLINNGDIQGGLQEIENEVYKNAVSTLKDTDVKQLSPQGAQKIIKQYDKIKELASKLTNKSALGLTVTNFEALKSDERQDFEASMQDIIATVKHDLSGTAASVNEANTIAGILGTGNFRGIDDTLRALDMQKSKLIDNMNIQRKGFRLPPISENQLRRSDINWSEIYFPNK